MSILSRRTFLGWLSAAPLLPALARVPIAAAAPVVASTPAPTMGWLTPYLWCWANDGPETIDVQSPNGLVRLAPGERVLIGVGIACHDSE